MYQYSDQDPVGPIGESAVSVYCTGLGCQVTLTRAASSLAEPWDNQRGRPDLARANSVRVSRKDAAIPQSTAHAFRECLRAAVRATRKPPDDGSIVNDNDRVEFWLIEPGTAPLKAERPDIPGKNTERLIDIGDELGHYCEWPESRRPEVARHIEQEAFRLRGVFARRNASN